MESSADIAQSLLSLSVAALFASSPSTLSSIEWKLSDRDFRGLAIRSVPEIDVRERDSLPVVLATQIDAVRDWETRLSDNLALVAFAHDSAEVTVGKPFDDRSANRPEPLESPARGPRPTGDAATGVATSVRMIDARRLLGIDWKTHTVSLFAISFDLVSNVTTVSLTGGGEPAPATFRKITVPPRADGKGLPSYDPAVVDVKAPADGVSFTVLPHAPSGRIVVRGSLSIAALPRHPLRAPAQLVNRMVAAVVPLTFLVVGRDWRAPWTFEWGVPAYGDSVLAPGTRISAFFAVPVPHDGDRTLPAGDYAAYIVMEGRVFGPHKFTMPTAPR